jgi:hypothetical protein
MKVTVIEKKKEKDIEFPCLMKCDDIIILATKKVGNYICGTTVNKSTSWNIGTHSDDWSGIKDGFKPFNGTITLQND